MDPGVWVALIAVFGAQLGALILGVQTARQRKSELAEAARERRDERQQDFDRSEAVRRAVEEAATKAAGAAELLAERDRRQEDEAQRAAGKAREAAGLLLEAQAETLRRTDEVARVAADSDTITQEKLDQIHTLVNSGLTDTRREVLQEMQQVRDLLQRLADADKDHGVETTQADLDTLKTTDERIATQQAILADREVQQAKVDEASKKTSE